MPSINPNREDLLAFAERMPSDTPILMLNLLRFNSQAAYNTRQPPCALQRARSLCALQPHRAEQGPRGGW